MTSVLLCADFKLTRAHRAARMFHSLLSTDSYIPCLLSPAIDNEDLIFQASPSDTQDNTKFLSIKNGIDRIPGSTHIGEKEALENLLERNKDTLFDVLFSFDNFSLELCSKLQSYYRSRGHRCLWFHDQFKGIPQSDVEIDNFQTRRSEFLKKHLLQTDAVTTPSHAASEFLYNHFRLPYKPIILKDFATTAVQKSSKKIERKKLKSRVSQKHVLFAGDTNNSFLLKAVIELVCPEHLLYVETSDDKQKNFFKNYPSISKSLYKNLVFLKKSDSEPSIGFDAVFVEGNPSFERENFDYVISVQSQTNPTFFLPNPQWNGEISADFQDLTIQYYNPLSPPHFDLHLLSEFLAEPTPKKARQKKVKSWENSSDNQIASLIDTYLWRLEDRGPVKVTDKVENLRVLHGLTGAAGQPWMLSRAQRTLGMKADTFCADGNKFAYRADKTLLNIDFNALSSFVKSHAPKYDIFQFYFRSYYFNKIVLSYPTALDLLALKAAGKRIIFYFMGSEIRFHSMYKEFSPYNYVEENPGNVANFPEQTQRRMFNIFSAIADGTAVSDPEMESYVPGTQIIERSIDLDEWPYCYPSENKRPLIVHAPSRQVVKGSEYVIKALESLKNKGVDFDFELVENLTQDKAREVYKRADIIVDQMRIGWYGFFTVEAMALGKAVVCYIREDLLDNFGSDGPPLAVADPDTIESVLLRLIENPSLRQMYGIKGRQFVENVHAKEKVAKKFMDLYQSSVENPKPLEMEEVAKYLVYQAEYANKELNRLRMKAK